MRQGKRWRPPTIATCRHPPYAIGDRRQKRNKKRNISHILFIYSALGAPQLRRPTDCIKRTHSIRHLKVPGRYVRCISFSCFSASARFNLGNVKKAWDIWEILRHVVLQLQMGHNWKLKMKLWCANRFHKKKTNYKSVHIRMIMREICESEVCDLARRPRA